MHRSIVEEIRQSQLEGKLIDVVQAGNAVPFEEYVRKMEDDAKASQRLNADYDLVKYRG